MSNIFFNKEYCGKKFATAFHDNDFSNLQLVNQNLSNSIFCHCSFHNALLEKSNFQNSIFYTCDLSSASLRYANLDNTTFLQCNCYAAVLEHSNMIGMNWDSTCQYLSMQCPETGGFIAYKKCLEEKIVKLWVPKDAKRSSSTYKTCRCDKAKVLVIQDIKETKHFDEAWSTVDENFSYPLGKWVYANQYNNNRWFDSTYGIHFFMKREDAIAY